MNNKEVFGLIIRYILLLILSIGNLYIIYAIVTPLTVYPVYYFLNYLYGVKLLVGNVIFINGYYAQIIEACIAGAAYYLLLILNLTTPLTYRKRMLSILFMIFTFLVLNILRIVFFATLLDNGYKYFDITHELTWYFGSTILVIIVWFATVSLFKIKEIPIYTDFKNIISDLSTNKKTRTRNNKK